jgi:hypothetical protein
MAGPKADLAQSTALVRGTHVLSTAEGLWMAYPQHDETLNTVSTTLGEPASWLAMGLRHTGRAS